MKNPRSAERLIVALDLPTAREALALVDHLGDSVHFYKIGLELAMSGDYFNLLAELKHRRKKVFADMKFFDIPQTVANAVANLAKHGADCVTVHGDPAIIRAACAHKGTMAVLAVTVLTSMSDEDLAIMGYRDNVANTVLARARYAQENGADGIIASGLEAPLIRHQLGRDLLLVIPGIRAEPAGDDQKRTLSLEAAFAGGADFVVMGRPIRDAHEPRAVAQSIQARLTQLFPQY